MPTMVRSNTLQLYAGTLDQFGDAMSPQPSAFNWSITSGPGILNSTGLYTSPNATGSATVQVQDQASGKTASTTINTAGTAVQTLTTLSIFPSTVKVQAGVIQSFTPLTKDQFGNFMNPLPAFTWSVPSGGGTVDSAGQYTAPGSPGSATVRVTAGSLTANAAVTIIAVQSPGATLSGGVLTIYPDNATAHPTYNRSQDKAQINGPTLFVILQSFDGANAMLLNQQLSFTAASVTSIEYYGQKSGKNFFTNITGLPMKCYCGPGVSSQMTTNSGGVDELYAGGTGSYNQLQGGRGADLIVGGPGTNYLYGSKGLDNLVPGIGPGSNNIFPYSVQ